MTSASDTQLPGTGLVAPVARHWPFWSMAAVVLAVVLGTSFIGSGELDQTVTEALIRLVVVLGIYLFVGNSGIISFGHIGFMAVGAYAEAWQTCCRALKPVIMPGLPDLLLYHSTPVVPAILLSGVFAALVALVTGVLIMRLSRVALSIATFAFLAIVIAIYSNWHRVTAGTSSIIGIPVLLSPWSATPWVLFTLLGTYLFQMSRLGLSLRASRDDEIAARAAGVRVFAARLAAYVLSAFFVGIGGALYSHFLGILSPSIFSLGFTFVALAMLVVGGIGSLSGAVLGVLAVSAFIELLRGLERGVSVHGVVLQLPAGSQEILLGVAILLILIFRPRGFTNGRDLPLPFPR